MQNDFVQFRTLDQVTWCKSASDVKLFDADKVEISFGGINSQPELNSTTMHVKQIHSTRIIDLDKQEVQLEQADGIFSKTKNTRVAIKTADCIPLLLSDETSFVMAVHAGWKGFAAGIIDNIGSHLGEKNLDLSQVKIAIGASISCKNFEVDLDVLKEFYKNKNTWIKEHFSFCLQKGKLGKWHIDLQTAAVFNLVSLGFNPKNISVVRLCTYDNESYNSYRRSGAKMGHNWSWIKLQN